jgi:hypothetical protein
MDYREVGNPTHEEVITGNMKPNPYNVKKKKKKIHFFQLFTCQN